MKMLLDIKENKADFMIELLKNFSFVKAEKLTPTKAQFLKELKGSVEEVTLAKQGKIKLQSQFGVGSPTAGAGAGIRPAKQINPHK